MTTTTIDNVTEDKVSAPALAAVQRMVPGANLAAYIQAVSAIPLLTVERERDLAERLYHENDVQAARELRQEFGAA